MSQKIIMPACSSATPGSGRSLTRRGSHVLLPSDRYLSLFVSLQNTQDGLLVGHEFLRPFFASHPT
jgi:hypothetical protein